ncbi:hypothetical protein PHLGIDRAFT_19513 [Phlebiopsis gigantea 11061_1 CR5-6]|uniref:DUF6534 domain-containing protein n=1 Tax=Phlebiopsis gigantea (strain 11061_1 CR5-6) TaxID=745531 RepID=A0A0C3PJC2_PHLG1|nr:hypothetical protein PHLGIDRAFT_19513 [Phlebiopsis gigantea 11061_1 CR5-6]
MPSIDTSTALIAPVSVTHDNTYGAAFIGTVVSAILFGVVCAQTYTYLNRYPLDRPFYKILVGVLWVLELVHSILVSHASYFYAITNWGNSLVLLFPPIWSLCVQVILGAIAGAIVKICFAMRVWRFSNGNRLVTGVIIVLALAQLVVACIYATRTLQLESVVVVSRLKVVGSLSLSLGTATDIVTAFALCFFLHGLRTGYSKDDSLVNRLTLYAVNTGILTSAVSVATMILYNLMPDNFIFMALYFVLSKLYANSFLATLNTRRVLRGRGTDAETNTVPTFLMVGKLTKHDNQFQDHVYPPSASRVPQTKEDMLRSQLEVEIEQEVTVTRDSHFEHHDFKNVSFA